MILSLVVISWEDTWALQAFFCGYPTALLFTMVKVQAGRRGLGSMFWGDVSVILFTTCSRISTIINAC
jgi:hypothetical protein